MELRDAGHGFYVPPCTACGGPLKPDVVFFGDGVPAWRSQRCAISSTCMSKRSLGDGACWTCGFETCSPCNVIAGLSMYMQANCKDSCIYTKLV